MTEIEWERTLGREQAAELLRKVADGLAGGDEVELEQDGFELKVDVADEVAVEIEVGLADGGTEVELEVKWETGGSSGSDEEDAAASTASPGFAAGSQAGGEDIGDAPAGSVD